MGAGVVHALQHCRLPVTGTHKAQCQSRRHQAAAAAQLAQAETSHSLTLRAQPLTPEAFAPFGQVVQPTADGKPYDDTDAQLLLDRGTPRLYVMNLRRTGMRFDRITHHAQVTQCLCGMGAEPWYLAVARPMQSVQAYPQQDDLAAFRVPPGVFLKLHQSTWHAGPLFSSMADCSFANLELADTNVVDHNTHIYSQDGSSVDSFEIVDEAEAC